MAEPFLGEIKLFSFNFAPRGWTMCNGQLLPINQNQAIFSLLGTTYGGNGTSNFALPNMQSRVVVGFGTGLGLSPYNMGQTGGEENHALLLSEMPAHLHTVACKSTIDNSPTPTSPVGNVWTRENNGDAPYASTNGSGLSAMHPSAIQPVGNGFPHPNLQPYLVVNFCIALQGIFPSRN
jgi:microcystin-dependent protein